MSESRRPDLKVVKPTANPNPGRSRAKVVHDARGNAVWDWAVDTRVLANKTVADLIDTLDAPGAGALSLEEETRVEAQRSSDPYNRPARVTRPGRAR